MASQPTDPDYSRTQMNLLATDRQDLEQVLASSLLRLRQQYPASQRLVLGVSGGLDSMVLLHACHRLRALADQGRADQGQAQRRPAWPFTGLRVVHVNHGISAHAADWQAHCQAACRELDIAFVAHQVQVSRAAGQGLEAGARAARYEVFEQELAADEALLLAHHQDDQLETVMLRLLRAAGPRGLAGMPESRALGAGMLWRPLLTLPREQLESWAARHAVSWVEDDSNDDDRLSRNFLRQHIMPSLASHWPGWRQSVARTAALGADADEILTEVADRWLAILSPDSDRLNCVSLLNLSAALQRLVIRHWLLRETGQTPGWRLVQRVQEELLGAGEDAQPEVNWQHWQLRRFAGQLHLLEALEPVPPTPAEGYAWQPQGDGRYVARVLPGNGILRLYQAPAGSAGDQVMRFPAGECVIRYRQGGEQCALPGRPGRSLKKILQESAIPPWVRERTPLLYIDNKLAWIVGVGVCEGFQAVDEGRGWAVRWQMPSRQDHI